MGASIHRNNDSVSYHFIHRGTGFGGSDDGVEIEWFMNKLFRMAIRKNLRTGDKRVIDFTDYTKVWGISTRRDCGRRINLCRLKT